MRPPELIVIADDRGRAALPETLARSSVRIIDCDDATALSSVGDAPLVIDVDLHDISKVKLIKDNLPEGIGARCRIIAVERGSHQSVVQAKGLGASDVLKRPFDNAALQACLRRHVVALADPGPLADEPGGHSIASAALALDRTFSGLVSGGPLDVASVQQANGSRSMNSGMVNPALLVRESFPSPAARCRR